MTSERIICSLMLTASMMCGAAEPFQITKGELPEIVIQEGLRPFVAKAAEDVAGDFEKIFGVRAKVTARGDARPPVAATNCIVLAKGGEGWENYTIESAAGNVLKITGSDDRGVMFGLYRFASECLGVDPFYFWSGREPECKDAMEWKGGISIKQGDPSFKFRGWFINDEDFLNGFRPKENGTRKIAYPRYHVVFGPSLAEAIYETAVRAGFNMMICASYVDILNPDEKRLIDIASSRGLYITTHHQEPVGAGALQLDLHFPKIKGTTYASHPDLWRAAWKRYIGEWAKVPDVVWQLGLRGRRDTPFWAVSGGGSTHGKPDEAEDRRRAGLISSAMREQLAMIEAAMGRKPEHYATQLWWEGADFYARKLLDIPEGTIVIFSDNSAGMKFQSDIGGVQSLDPAKKFGLYYHLALVHGNHRCELVPPLRTHQILGDTWRKGAREFVLFNVSNVRPFLYTIEAAGEMTRDIGAFNADAFRDRWVNARFGKNAAVARAIDLYFAAYETEYSRDGVSSYGSPRERAPLALLHDGMLCSGLYAQIKGFAAGEGRKPAPVVSQYVEDPDRLTPKGNSVNDRATHDQHPNLVDKGRTRLRAITQAAAFERCVEQIERAAARMDEAQKRQLFERFGYPAEFMRLSSSMFAEMSAAREARGLGDEPCAIRHAKAALAFGEERDRLDKRYASGKWEHWYDRDLIYPCRSVTEILRNALKGTTNVTLRVGTYNIRVAGHGADKGTPNAWGARKKDLVDLLGKLELDAFGAQEVRQDQARYIRKHLPGFAYVGDFRNKDRKHGEASPIFYRKDRLEAEKSGTFWLSKTPDVPGSKGWDARYPRICTWVILRDKRMGRRFCFVNTHPEANGAVAREKGMQLIVERMKEFAEGLPIVFTGDYNSNEDEVPARAVKKVLKDALYESKAPPTGPWRTYTRRCWREKEVSAVEALKFPREYRNPPRVGSPNYGKVDVKMYCGQPHCGPRIDFIYVSPGVTVKSYATHADSRPGMEYYPSDHFPVTADIEL